MKISIIGSRGYPYVYSGYETFVKELSERLVNKGIDVTVYCHRNLFNSRPKEVNGIRLKYFYSPQTKSLSQLINSFQAIIHACFQKDNIILVVNSANGPLGLISKIARKKTAINVDGLEWLRPKWKGLGGKYFYWASKMATRFYNVIINDSDSMRDVYLKEFKKDSIVIAYGANIRYSKNPELIKKWNLKNGSYYLIVGRLIPDNNADLIVKEFIESTTDRKLVIVGDVPYKDSYASNIKKNRDPRLLFTGYVTNQDELAELYHNCFAYFHGHEFGGTNPTMLKALAYGCAILALDTVFNKEMLEDWEYGIQFSKEEGNLKMLIDSVDSNEKQMEIFRKKSRNRVMKNYTWEKITQQYINLFKEMN